MIAEETASTLASIAESRSPEDSVSQKTKTKTTLATKTRQVPASRLWFKSSRGHHKIRWCHSLF